MRLSSLVPVLLCTALCPLKSSAHQDAAETQSSASISRLVNNVWQTVINGGSKPVDLAARAKSDAEAGMARITDDNYDTIFSQSRPDDLWVVAVWVEVDATDARFTLTPATGAKRTSCLTHTWRHMPMLARY